MNKTPIQKAIEWCNEQMEKEGTYRPFVINFKAKLISLLPEEKQFAKDAYGAGYDQGHDSGEWNGGQEFLNYFKQYEDEQLST